MGTYRFTTFFAGASALLLVGCASGNDTGEMEEIRTEQRTVDFSQWDENDDQTLDREEFRIFVNEAQLFGELDANMDGEMSQEELAQGLLDRWDEDGDGALSEGEWEESTDNALSDEIERGSWQDWDSDGDSELDLNEVREGLETDGVYDHLDRDDDAVFDDEELADFFFDTFDFDDDDEIDTTEWDDFSGS